MKDDDDSPIKQIIHINYTTLKQKIIFLLKQKDVNTVTRNETHAFLDK